MALRKNWRKLIRQAIRLEVGVDRQLRDPEVGEIEKIQVTYQYQDGLDKEDPRRFELDKHTIMQRISCTLLDSA